MTANVRFALLAAEGREKRMIELKKQLISKVEAPTFVDQADLSIAGAVSPELVAKLLIGGTYKDLKTLDVQIRKAVLEESLELARIEGKAVERALHERAIKALENEMGDMGEFDESPLPPDLRDRILRRFRDCCAAAVSWESREQDMQKRVEREIESANLAQAESGRRIEALQRDLELAKQQVAKLTQGVHGKGMRNLRRGLAAVGYLVLLMSAIYLSVRGMRSWSDTSFQISVEYNVGEIIGGLLGGAGIAAAGIAYAVKVFRGDN